MTLLEYARDEVGVAMGGLVNGVHYGWTTDPAKAEALREAGARLQPVALIDRTGWEVGFPVGAERMLPAAGTDDSPE